MWFDAAIGEQQDKHGFCRPTIQRKITGEAVLCPVSYSENSAAIMMPTSEVQPHDY